MNGWVVSEGVRKEGRKMATLLLYTHTHTLYTAQIMHYTLITIGEFSLLSSMMGL